MYSLVGEQITELAGREYAAGNHSLELEVENLSGGIYFYTLKTDNYAATRKMILQKQ